MDKIKLIIVDDHPLWREGLRKIFSMDSRIEVIGEAGEGRDAIELVRRKKPDVVLMDINMPGINGIEATKAIKREVPQTAIVALTIHDDRQYITELMHAGVGGYVLKDIEADTLLDVICTVSKGETVVHPAITRKVFGSNSLFINNEGSSQLSKREKEVLSLVSKGLTNKEIAKALFISEKTVKNHLTSIFRKLEVADRTQAALYAVKHGLEEA